MPLPVFNINKVLWMQLKYRSGSYIRETRPKKYTVHGVDIEAGELALAHDDYPHETVYERARRLEILDSWRPVLYVVFSSTRHLTFEGKRALSIYKEWNSRIFGKKET
jgi:hypothetical protein